MSDIWHKFRLWKIPLLHWHEYRSVRAIKSEIFTHLKYNDYDKDNHI